MKKYSMGLRLKEYEVQNFTVRLKKKKSPLELLEKNVEVSVKLYLYAIHKTQILCILRYYIFQHYSILPYHKP